MQRNYLVTGPISGSLITALLDKMGGEKSCGGLSFFIGQVRADIINGKIVKAIEYSAYEGMVEAEADKIKEAILREFGDVRSIDIVHSTGIVTAGQISLLVAVSAGHRKQAIEACSKAVELIKERLPVWKKEVYEDNSHIWK
jgi:molybdopterin synthase catalytic subunit